ncbi:MAG: sigma-70 family RNA polymerase sigma factor [Nitrospirota bacterium]|nr:sigma-70 family RNA polymerase sigma factor [Nitrospirota bacterium]
MLLPFIFSRKLVLFLAVPNLSDPLPRDEASLVRALQDGDETVFSAVMDQYSGSLLRLAMAYVPSRAVAEEVVQETWIGVLEGIGRFEGRSSFKTWVFRILTNRAKTRGTRERRYEPFGLAGVDSEKDEGSSLEDSLFVAEGSGSGHWVDPPQGWEADTPERALLSKECRIAIEEAINGLPDNQRQVITLRDVEGVSAEEVCNILTISETNQRVLLHRARTKVRRVLDPYVRGGNS